MPIGYLITTALMATATVAAASRHRPRSSKPFRLSYVFGLWLNWPFIAFLALLASTVWAIAQSGVGSLVFWIGFAFAALASAGLVPLRRRALGTGPALERALDEGLGSDWRNEVDPELPLASVVDPPSPASCSHRSPLAATVSSGSGTSATALRAGETCSMSIAIAPIVRAAQRSSTSTVVASSLAASDSEHATSSIGSPAPAGCASVRTTAPDFPDQLTDMKRMISWTREHAGEYGADPAAVFLAGSSAGAHLASLAALTPDDPRFQPDFESADTSVAGAITLYGYYGPVASGDPPSSPLAYVTTKAPPYFVVHGDQDSLVVVDDARRFVEQLRAASSNPVVYAELPGAQHGFDLFRSRRFETVVDAIEVFAAGVRSAPESFGTNSERHPRLP